MHYLVIESNASFLKDCLFESELSQTNAGERKIFAAGHV
jgi:hypothetical protein